MFRIILLADIPVLEDVSLLVSMTVIRISPVTYSVIAPDSPRMKSPS